MTADKIVPPLLKRVFDDAELIEKILLDALKSLDAEQNCQCRELRKETLLKEIYDAE